MPQAILGISAYYHDSAAALVVDGEIVAAAQEERFTRKKHDHRFPIHAVNFCLQAAGIKASELTYVGFYDRPRTKFARLIETYAAFAPFGLKSYLQAVPLWLRKKLHLTEDIAAALNHQYRGATVYCDHHESHAASAFFPSPFEEAAILTLDGVGEWSTATMGIGRHNRVTLTHELRFPHSLGLLYSAFTYYTGFKVNSGEYKVMGLAPYGEPRFKDLILTRLMDLKEDGSFQLDMSYFNYCQGTTMTNTKFHRLFGGPPRKPETLLTQREMDLASSVQAACEEIMLRCARHLHRLTGMKHLVLAGGVALNCVGNGRILREGPFENVWIQPASGDAGGALGVALIIWHHLLGEKRPVTGCDRQHGSLLGPAFSEQDIRAFLDQTGAKYQVFADVSELDRKIAEWLSQEKVIGLFQGRMEFGPRALGARSILGDARSDQMQNVMNLKIKFRESFRPFAPIVLREYASDFFDFPAHAESPYMLLTAPVSERHRQADSQDQMKGRWGLEQLYVRRSDIPAVTHVDYSARLQTVDAERFPRLHGILKAFHEKTGCPVAINTSFNIRGEPIVGTPADAFRCFMGTHIDVLILENIALLKEDQPQANFDAKAYRERFQLD